MAIIRDEQTGFELGNIGIVESTGYVGNGTHIRTTADKKTGSYALRNEATNYTGGTWWDISTSRQKRVAFHCKIGNAWSTNRQRFCSLQYVDTTEIVSLRQQPASNIIRLWVGGVERASYAGCIVGSWYHFGIDVKIDSVNGWVYIYLDGLLIMSYTGNTGNADVGRFMFGSWSSGGGLTGGTYWYWDDLTIDDSTGEGAPAPVQDRRYQFKIPVDAAEGETYKQWLGSDADSVDNWALVDEIPHNSDTDYVVAGSTGLLDSYEHATFTLPTNGVITAVIPIAVAKAGDVSDTLLGLGTRLSGTDLIGSGQSLQTSYGFRKLERQAAKPGGGAWSETDVNNAEIVIKSLGTYT